MNIGPKIKLLQISENSFLKLLLLSLPYNIHTQGIRHLKLISIQLLQPPHTSTTSQIHNSFQSFIDIRKCSCFFGTYELTLWDSGIRLLRKLREAHIQYLPSTSTTVSFPSIIHVTLPCKPRIVFLLQFLAFCSIPLLLHKWQWKLRWE